MATMHAYAEHGDRRRFGFCSLTRRIITSVAFLDAAHLPRFELVKAGRRWWLNNLLTFQSISQLRHRPLMRTKESIRPTN